MSLAKEFHDLLHKKIKTALHNLAKHEMSKYRQMFVDSDKRLKAMIDHIRDNVMEEFPSDGNVEFGLVPFWVAHPEQIPDAHEFSDALIELIKLLGITGLVPPSTVSVDDYQVLEKAQENGTAIAPNGTILSKEKYALMDSHWFEALFNDILTRGIYGNAKFGYTPYINKDIGDDVTISLVGDWGTGTPVATALINNAASKKPDFLIHLGDVYYTGTPKHKEERLYWGADSEVNNLVKHWPTEPSSMVSLALNSNHEMYCGGHGYFRDALGAEAFKKQKGTSYFLLENNDWQIFGLDSAFYSHSPLYDFGALSDDGHKAQTEFIAEHHDKNKRVMLLTHHVPCSTRRDIVGTGDYGPLWTDAVKALGNRPPDYWYFGHLHCGIVYAPVEVSGTTCFLRCVGHSAIPSGAPWGLAKSGATPPYTKSDYIDTVEFCASTPEHADQPGSYAVNGYAVVGLQGKTITESMYDADGKQTFSKIESR
jgi:hypothetical protein